MGCFNAGRGLFFSTGFLLRFNLFLQPYGDQASLSACSAFKSLALCCDWCWPALPQHFSTGAQLAPADGVNLLAHGITSHNRLPPPGHALGCCSPLKPYCHHVSVRAVLPPTMPQCYCRKAPICKAESDLPLPLRCFQASVLSSVDSSSISISRGIHSSLLSFNTAVIVVSSSPSYGFSLQQEQSRGITEPMRTCLPWNTHPGVQRISPAPQAGGRGDFASCCCLSLCISAGGLWSLQDSGQSVVSYLL